MMDTKQRTRIRLSEVLDRVIQETHRAEQEGMFPWMGESHERRRIIDKAIDGIVDALAAEGIEIQV